MDLILVQDWIILSLTFPADWRVNQTPIEIQLQKNNDAFLVSNASHNFLDCTKIIACLANIAFRKRTVDFTPTITKECSKSSIHWNGPNWLGYIELYTLCWGSLWPKLEFTDTCQLSCPKIDKSQKFDIWYLLKMILSCFELDSWYKRSCVLMLPRWSSLAESFFATFIDGRIMNISSDGIDVGLTGYAHETMSKHSFTRPSYNLHFRERVRSLILGSGVSFPNPNVLYDNWNINFKELARSLPISNALMANLSSLRIVIDK